MTPEGWRWIRKSVVSITGVEIWAACWASAVIRSAGASRSTCRVCWLSMLQCCVNSILELITFFAIGRWRLAGRWPRQRSIRSPVCIRYTGAEVWRWRLTAGPGVRGCGVRGWAMFLQLTRPPPHFHMKGLLRTVHKTVLAVYQQLPSILRPTSLHKQPSLSPTTKMLLSFRQMPPSHLSLAAHGCLSLWGSAFNYKD